MFIILISMSGLHRVLAILNDPIVDLGDKVKAGQVIIDGPSSEKGELALGC